MSDLTNEQLMELIEEIKKKNGGETDAKNWSHEDIERLLELTERETESPRSSPPRTKNSLNPKQNRPSKKQKNPTRFRRRMPKKRKS
mgnify:CR=1 FL=1